MAEVAGIGERPGRISKVYVIESVERFGSDLDTVAFEGHLEILAERHVGSKEGSAAKGVAVTDAAGVGPDKGVGMTPDKELD